MYGAIGGPLMFETHQACEESLFEFCGVLDSAQLWLFSGIAEAGCSPGP